MASRRSRSRPDKRAITYHAGDAPDIEAAFARLTAERKERREPEPEVITLKTGHRIDTRADWNFPTNSEGAV